MAIIVWNVTGAVRVEISHGIGVVAASGEMEVFPTTNTTYVVTATDSSGRQQASNIHVNGTSPASNGAGAIVDGVLQGSLVGKVYINQSGAGRVDIDTTKYGAAYVNVVADNTVINILPAGTVVTSTTTEAQLTVFDLLVRQGNGGKHPVTFTSGSVSLNWPGATIQQQAASPQYSAMVEGLFDHIRLIGTGTAWSAMSSIKMMTNT